MESLRRWLTDFFFPGKGSPLWRRVLPYAALGVLSLITLVAGTYAWDYTNSPDFCGTTCHTMPPEFNAYLVSPHARVQCVECHIGRGFFATRFTRKAGDVRHIISLAFRQYEFPIRVKTLRPARDTCERCHFPEKFSNDSLVQLHRFGNDEDNSASTIYLTLKTGGGSERQGLGRGIHWHIENEVLYYATDELQQDIPYVLVVDEDGTAEEFVEVGSGVDPEQIESGQLERMDCITCHNRITHLIYPPEDSVDQMLYRGLISPSIPEIRQKAVETLRAAVDAADDEQAINMIDGLAAFYAATYPNFYDANQSMVTSAIEQVQQIYRDSVFREQKADWRTSPNNAGHMDSPGCFRCHDGKHLNGSNEAIRLECNLCHSIPVVASADDLVAEIEISRGPEPESHLNPNWISLHHLAFNTSCESCHTTGDPGGTSDTTFCSNSACHGSVFDYAGFDAPQLREVLADQFPATATPAPIPDIEAADEITYDSVIGQLLENRCGQCHSDEGVAGLNMTTYDTLLTGSNSGPVIIPSDAEASVLVEVQSSENGHFGQLSPEELELMIDWINAGALEN